MLVYPSIQILSFLTNYGHRIAWVIESELGTAPSKLNVGDVEVYVVPYRRYLPGNSVLSKIPNTILNSIGKIRPVLKIFRDGGFDLILVRHEMRSLDGLIGVLIKRLYKVPLVLELSNPIEHWEETRLNNPRLKFLQYLAAKIDEFLVKRVVFRADLILPISKWLERDLNESKGIPLHRLMALPEGVNERLFSDRDGGWVRSKYGLDGSSVIIYEGEMNRGRQLDLLIRAFSLVIQECPDTKLLMVGDGNDREYLETVAQETGSQDRIIFTGRVPQLEIPDFIAAADIGVSPIPPLTFYKFSSPIKLVEYMALGRPVVANAEIPDHKEVLEQSGGGILVSFSAEAFANAMVQLLRNRESAVEMGVRGRAWVLENRSFGVLSRKLEAKYLELFELSRKSE